MDIRRTVLLADANEEFRLMLREAIEKSGEFTVAATTGDGAELLRLAEQHRPDLVVMDVVLPTVDGLSVMQRPGGGGGPGAGCLLLPAQAL